MFKIDVWYNNYSQSQRWFQAIIPGITKPFQDTKGVIWSRKLKNRQYNGQKKKDKKQTI